MRWCCNPEEALQKQPGHYPNETVHHRPVHYKAATFNFDSLFKYTLKLNYSMYDIN
jgi:hypothetical protein